VWEKTHFFSQRAHLGFETIDLYEGDQNFDGTYVSDYHRWLRERTNGLVEEPMHGVDWNSWYARPSHLPEELHNNTWVFGSNSEIWIIIWFNKVYCIEDECDIGRGAG
jgi:hypothetical protein